MKYIKLFETHSEYETYIGGQDVILPNVSYCEDNNCVHYNPIVPPSRVIKCTINVETTSNLTVLFADWYGTAWNKVESALVTRPNGTTFEITYNDLIQYDPYEDIDPYMCYQFDTIGIHTLEYTLKPNVTSLTNHDMLDSPRNILSIEIPNCISSIGTTAIGFCDKLTTLILPNSITSLGVDDSIIMEAPNLTSVTILATTPPECHGILITEHDRYTIYVPADSVNAYKTAEDWTYYASKIQAIPTT